MSARSISRLVGTGLAAGALTVALSVPAFAAPARDSSGTPLPGSPGVTVGQTANASGNVTAGTDVAAPDQQNPTPTRSTLIVTPSPARPYPHGIASSQTASANASGAFQWADAGIGAGGVLVVALTALGGVWILRRRHDADTPLAA
jgi:hypothetical protein